MNLFRSIYLILFITIIGLQMHAQPTQVTVRAFSQGYFRPSLGRMVAVIDSIHLPTVCDTVTIGFIQTNMQSMMFCTRALISTDGYASCSIPVSYTGIKCIISVQFRGTFHLMSRDSFLLNGGNIFVDLTDTENVRKDFRSQFGVATAISGDMDGDGVVDLFDFPLWDSGFQKGLTGYLVSDLNGNSIIDTMDFAIYDENNQNYKIDPFRGSCTPSVVGINEIKNTTFKIIPNPSSNIFKFANPIGASDLYIYNRRGIECYHRTIDPHAEWCIVNCSNLVPGVYMLCLESSYKRVSSRLSIRSDR